MKFLVLLLFVFTTRWQCTCTTYSTLCDERPRRKTIQYSIVQSSTVPSLQHCISPIPVALQLYLSRESSSTVLQQQREASSYCTASLLPCSMQQVCTQHYSTVVWNCSSVPVGVQHGRLYRHHKFISRRKTTQNTKHTHHSSQSPLKATHTQNKRANKKTPLLFSFLCAFVFFFYHTFKHNNTTLNDPSASSHNIIFYT